MTQSSEGTKNEQAKDNVKRQAEGTLKRKLRALTCLELERNKKQKAGED